MKHNIYIWTKWNPTTKRHKCIYISTADVIPRIGESITIRDGFSAHQVIGVQYEIEPAPLKIHIYLDLIDENNEYGGCLFYSDKSK